MPLAEEMRHQVQALTIDLIGLSLCNAQNFPSLRNIGQDTYEISVHSLTGFGNILRNVPYSHIYNEIASANAYNIKMLDGALVQIMYRFIRDDISAHRLAFFPSPYLEEFQNNPEIYINDEVYAEVVRRDIVPFPLRFDFDSNDEIYRELDHPKSHLTLGQYKNCRIPVCAPLTPYHFISFILRSFYHTAYSKYSDNIRQHSQSFFETISNSEKDIIHVQVPMSR